MKKKAKQSTNGEMQKEYDFRSGVPGKYAPRYAEGTNLVRLSPDVAKFFPTEESVNTALRACADIIRTQKKRKRA